MLSVVKAIPLVLALIGLIFIVAIADDINDISGLDTFDGAILAIVLTFLLFIGIGTLLLVFHIRSVLKNQMLTLAVVAGIMGVIDLLGLLGTVTDEEVSPASVLLMLVVFAAQATIFGWALKARNANPF
ncbi:MAG: hypothetical protein AAFO29_05010 [Actinomycetota bacterium]